MRLGLAAAPTSAVPHLNAGTATGWQAPEGVELDLGMNGTALRTVTAIVGLLGGRVRVDGDPALRRRPLDELVCALEALAVRFEFEGDRFRVPFVIDAPCRESAELRIDARRTSQAATGLLFGLAALPDGGRLCVQGPLGYVPLTLAWLAEFGVEFAVETRQGEHVFERQSPAISGREAVEVPADPSSATWILALAAGLGREIEIAGLDARGLGRAHPDLAFIIDLQRLGHEVVCDEQVLVLSPSPTLGEGDFSVELEARPDSAPPLVALLSARPGRHRISAPRLRAKESDRIATLCRGLELLGFSCKETETGLEFEGCRPGELSLNGPARVEVAEDHRMAMAFATLARIHGLEVEIDDPQAVTKSWPGFWEALDSF